MKKIILTLLLGGSSLYFFRTQNQMQTDSGFEQGHINNGNNLAVRSPSAVDSSRAEKVVDKLPEKKFDDLKIKKASSKLSYLKKCLQVENCPYDNSDPRAYGISIGRDMAHQLNVIYLRAEEKGVISVELEILAREYISVMDGHVKEQALNLLATQPPSEQNLQSILDNVFNYHDDALIEQGVLELEKYVQLGYEDKVLQAIAQVFEKGSLMVREKLALKLKHLITAENRDFFKRILNSLPVNSKSALYLKSHLSHWN